MFWSPWDTFIRRINSFSGSWHCNGLWLMQFTNWLVNASHPPVVLDNFLIKWKIHIQFQSALRTAWVLCCDSCCVVCCEQEWMWSISPFILTEITNSSGFGHFWSLVLQSMVARHPMLLMLTWSVCTFKWASSRWWDFTAVSSSRPGSVVYDMIR